MNLLKRTFAAAIPLLAFHAFAIPGVKAAVPDQSGQFVYYKDSTFTRDSYIGIIFYDDTTYGLRYYAPSTDSQPEIDMQDFITIDGNEERDAIELTGERFEPFPQTQEETDVANYLHDFVYELFPRRKNAGDVAEKRSVSDTYEQFGGRVSLEFDPVIPILNLSRITTSDGKIALEAVTGGRLSSSTDTSFSSFKGFPKDVPAGKKEKIKKGKKNDILVENDGLKSLSVSLDTSWEQKSPATWMLGDYAAQSVVALMLPAEKKGAFIRSLILGRDHTYPNWTKMRISESGGSTKIEQEFLFPESASVKRDFKKIVPLGNDATGIFALTVNENAYKNNKKYFDKIISSYDVK
ncbi:MAG: hypothetical protein IIU02_07055 [Treponema sp.]|uniref:hypothetical protein n=1 Tax=Treponema sp. TaxID=166 RepID=UPI00257BBC78|nr:hypothetical protein [Treponema sp.]MBQ5537653.1 hypothetical protein [Treponema sp.]